jgi:hypothetical protein
LLGGLYTLLPSKDTYVLTDAYLYPVVRLLNVLLWFGSSVLLYLLIKSLGKSKQIALLSVLLWSGSSVAAFWVTSGMETILYTFVSLVLLLTCVRALKSPRICYLHCVIWALELGLLPLIRPEGFVLSALCGILLLHKIWSMDLDNFSQKTKHTAVLVLLSLSLASSYYIAIYVLTGDILPTSARSRTILMRMDTGVQIFGPFSLSQLGLNTVFPQVSPWYISFSFLFGAFLLIRESIRQSGVQRLMHALIMIWIFINLFYYNLIAGVSTHRYYLVIVPLFYFVAAYSINQLSRRLLIHRSWKWVIFLLFIGVFLSGQWSVLQSERQFIEITSARSRFFPREARWLAENTPVDARILAYEVQIAYYSEREVLSLDGIIGGEVLSYLGIGNDLYEFVDANRPDYYFSYVNRVHKHRFWEQTIFRPLQEFNSSRDIGRGDFFQIDDIRFERVYTNVYKIQYDTPHLLGDLNCKRRSWQMTYQAENLPSGLEIDNMTQPDSYADNGLARYVDTDFVKDETAILYGPYIELSPGRYDAVFRVRRGSTAVPSSGTVAVLDVARNATSINSIELLDYDLSSGYKDIILPFTISQANQLVELRVFYRPSIDLFLDYVAITGCMDLSDHQ